MVLLLRSPMLAASEGMKWVLVLGAGRVGKRSAAHGRTTCFARKVADGTYVPRAYLAVGLGKKSRRQQSTQMMERAGREGSMEWFGGQWNRSASGSGVELTGLDA